MKRQLRFIAMLWIVLHIGDSIVIDVSAVFGRSAPIDPWYGLRFVFNSYTLLSHYLAPVFVFALLWLVTRERGRS